MTFSFLFPFEMCGLVSLSLGVGIWKSVLPALLWQLHFTRCLPEFRYSSRQIDKMGLGPTLSNSENTWI